LCPLTDVMLELDPSTKAKYHWTKRIEGRGREKGQSTEVLLRSLAEAVEGQERVGKNLSVCGKGNEEMKMKKSDKWSRALCARRLVDLQSNCQISFAE
jgi:hypothetical protein